MQTSSIMDCDEKMNTVCLCCLTEKGQMKNMQDNLLASVQLTEAYKICSGITLEEIEEQIPFSDKMICCTCEQKLLTSIEFRDLCRQSYQTLKKKSTLSSIPNLFLDVKQEFESDDERGSGVSEILVMEKPVSFNEVFILNEFTDGDTNLCSPSSTSKSKKRKKNAADSKKLSVEVPSDVDVSDLESDYVCLRCDKILPTHKEYLKHFEQHKLGNGIPRIHKVCDICEVFTKRYTKHIFEQHKDYRPYKCKYCVKNFQTSGTLRSHLISHVVSKAPAHECLTCNDKFKRFDTLRIHISNHNNTNNQYFCPFCGLAFDQFSFLSEHFFLKHDTNRTKNLYPCFRCKRVYMVKMCFDNHECSGKITNVTPEPVTTVKCERCSGEFSSQDEFVCHQYLGCRDTPTPYCAKCDKTFANKTKLKQHDTQAHVEKPKRFVCDICGRGYVDKAHYAKHKASHGTERNFKCLYPGCEAAFKHASFLKGHLLVHDKKMDYECHLCNKRFAFYASIKRHIYTHAESSEFRKFACKICGKRLATSFAYSKHLIFHSGEKTVQCQACPKRFLDIPSSNRHYRTFHDKQHWQCKFCDTKCKSVIAFKQHMFKHRGFYPYNCAMCCVHYADKYLYKRHLQKHHSIIYDEKIHGYVEKVNLDALVKECERKNELNLENAELQAAA